MDPYERLAAINESMKKALAMFRKNPAAMADVQNISGKSPKLQTRRLRNLIRHGSSPLASERPDSIHGKINRRSGTYLDSYGEYGHPGKRRSPMIQTHHRSDAIGFPGDDTTKFDTDIVQLGRAKGVELPATKAEFKKKYGLQKESETKNETPEETPETRRKKIFKAIDRAANTTEDPNRVAARLAAQTRKQDRSIFGDSPFGGSIVGESTEAERIDQAGAKGKKALKDAGLKFKFRQSIGSMNREDNHFIVSPKDVEAAKKALKGVSNAQVKTK